jgi:hypothetical protein
MSDWSATESTISAEAGLDVRTPLHPGLFLTDRYLEDDNAGGYNVFCCDHIALATRLTLFRS